MAGIDYEGDLRRAVSDDGFEDYGELMRIVHEHVALAGKVRAFLDVPRGEEGGAFDSLASEHERLNVAIDEALVALGIPRNTPVSLCADDELRALTDAIAARKRAIDALSAPVPMLLTCPACNARHIDEGEFATKVHHTHSCQHCGMTWRPAVVATVGVRFLPGFKNAEPSVERPPFNTMVPTLDATDRSRR